MTALTRPIEQAFRSARIPYQVVGGVAFYERQEIKDVLAYLNLMVNPKDDMAFTRVGERPAAGPGKDVGRASDRRGTAARDSPPGDGPRGQFRHRHQRQGRPRPAKNLPRLIDELAALRDRPAEEVVQQLLTRIDYREHLKADTRDNGEDRLANLDELITAAREFDQTHAGAVDRGLPGGDHPGLGDRPLG